MKRLFLAVLAFSGMVFAQAGQGDNDVVDVKNKNGIYYEKNSNLGVPFTGVGREILRDDKECFEFVYELDRGVPNGKWEKWSCDDRGVGKDAKILSEGMRSNGNPVGLEKGWDYKGNLTKEVFYNKNGGIDFGYVVREGEEDMNYMNSIKSGWVVEAFMGRNKDEVIYRKITYNQGKEVKREDI